MPFSYSSRSIRNRPSVQAMQGGGYQRAGGVPDANDPVANYGAYAGNTPTHVGSMSAGEYNSSMARRGRERSQAFRDDAKEQGGLAKVVQGINSVRPGRNWDALAGALDMFGVDKLQTGAAAGYEAPGFFDYPSMNALQEQRATQLDTSDLNSVLAAFQNRRR
jgi:hypothetical protein